MFVKLLLLSVFVFLAGTGGAFATQICNIRSFFNDEEMDGLSGRIAMVMAFSMVSLVGFVGGILCVVFRIFGYLE